MTPRRKIHRTRNTVPTVAEFLRENPLPPDLRHFEPLLRSSVGQDVLNVVLLAAAAGLDEPTILKFMEQLREHHAADAWRCSCCLNWTATAAKTGALLRGAVLHIVTTCQPCYERIMAGKQTDAMRKNLRAYVGEVVVK
jgi:hypothetical protein